MINFWIIVILILVITAITIKIIKDKKSGVICSSCPGCKKELTCKKRQ